MKAFTADEATVARIREVGKWMVRNPDPVLVVRVFTEDFLVETSAGIMAGKEGDYLAYDPQSGHVWPITPEYLEMHYKEAPWVGQIGQG
jgi:hypothetical protein